MKLIPKIYLAFGSILLAFIFVTISFIEQSENVESDVNEALRAAEVMRLSETLEKTLVVAQTGVRGFQVSDNEAFLDPYYKSLEDYGGIKDSLTSVVKDPTQLKRLNEIDSTFSHWLNDFAEPAIRLQKASLANTDALPAFNEFQREKIRAGAGKLIMDDVHKQFYDFRKREQEIRDNRSQVLKSSISLTDQLAIILTIACVVIGLIVVFFLAQAIKSRLVEMADMADRISMGNFDVQLQDLKNDEISRVSKSLNIMAKKLDDSFTKLQKTNKELDQFAYVVSHDLKAPLRALFSLAEWIEEDLPDVDPDVKRNLQLMRGRVFRMENLINGILEYSRIGRSEVKKSTFSVYQLVHEILDSLSLPGNVQLDISNTLPTVTAGKIMLQQVFTNLISNAVKYNDKPVPAIRIGHIEQKGGYEFYVTDNGPGIPAEYHQKIFGIFQTMEARDTRESTGVGLAIVKKIIEEHGGYIRIESQIGEGSSFIFSWPKETVLKPQHTELATAASIA